MAKIIALVALFFVLDLISLVLLCAFIGVGPALLIYFAAMIIGKLVINKRRSLVQQVPNSIQIMTLYYTFIEFLLFAPGIISTLLAALLLIPASSKLLLRSFTAILQIFMASRGMTMQQGVFTKQSKATSPDDEGFFHDYEDKGNVYDYNLGNADKADENDGINNRKS